MISTLPDHTTPTEIPPADLAAELRALLLAGYAVHIEPRFTSYGVVFCDVRIQRERTPFFPAPLETSSNGEIKAVASGLAPTRPLVRSFHVIFELGSLAAWLREVRGVLVR